MIEDRFGKKGEQVVAKNKEAVKKGYDYALAHFGQLKKLPDPEPEEDGGGHLFLSGNEASPWERCCRMPFFGRLPDHARDGDHVCGAGPFSPVRRKSDSGGG